MGKFYLFIIACFSFLPSFGQCPVINSAMVNSCAQGGGEGINEFVVFTTTVQAPVSAYTLYYGSNNPATQSPSGKLPGTNTTTKNGTGSFVTTNGCNFIQVSNSTTIIPANSTVIFIPADFDQQYDVTGICNGSLYIVYINRSASGSTWNAGGVLANTPSTKRYLQITNGASTTCTSGVRTYSYQWPGNDDGNSVWWSSDGSEKYINNGCGSIIPPVEAVSVAPIDPSPFCMGVNNVQVAYTVQGNPDRYSLVWDAAALAAGFSNVVNGTLTGGNITVTVPVMAAEGTYKVNLTVSKSTGGTSSPVKTVTLTIKGIPNVVITNPVSVCSPSTIDLTDPSITVGSSSGLTFNYYTDILATNLLSNPTQVNTSGTYYIKATNAGGCFVIKPVEVKINNLPDLVITHPASVCLPSVVDLTGSAVTAGSSSGLTLNYYTDILGTSLLSNPTQINVSGTYYIKATNAGGCSVIKPVEVKVNKLPNAPLISGNHEMCLGTTTLLNASVAGGIWSSSNNTIATVDALGNLLAMKEGQTDILYTITAACGSVSSVPFSVVINTLALPGQIAGTSQLKLGEQGVLSVDRTGGTWQSSNPAVVTVDQNGKIMGIKEGESEITYLENTSCGLVKTGPFNLRVIFTNDLFIPNAFTPNGDGRNDKFIVYGTSVNKMELFVFNQWGELVYETADMSQGWDGTYKNEKQPAGVYVYTAKITMKNGEQLVRKGAVNLIR